MENAGWIAIALFMIGVVFQAGSHSARLKTLEDGQRSLHEHLDRIEALIRREGNYQP
jgi:hypothetical protein